MTPPSPNLPHPMLRPRRVGVCGGTDLKPDNVAFCRALGEALVREEGLVLITGGYWRRKTDKEDHGSAEYWIIRGALDPLKAQGLPADTRIETLLPDPGHDMEQVVRFRAGKTLELRNRHPQARRFTLVNT